MKAPLGPEHHDEATALLRAHVLSVLCNRVRTQLLCMLLAVWSRVLLLACAAIVGACSETYPDRWDYCDSPGAGTIQTLELVRPIAAAAEPVEDGFATVQDTATVTTTFGGQGFEMLDVHLRMTGDVPGCIDQTSALQALDGEVLVSETSARVAFRQADSSYRTWTIWLVLTDEIPRGELIELVATAGNRTARARIVIEPGS